ncbi:MAG: Gfo/Idh/MocA family oxidoreductase [Anaerolineales bacterium]|nr:Gfo/Idh/MocA family oxidoreductase [Anaerolineales bacterium]
MPKTGKIKIGILGTGFGQTHARRFASFPDVEVVGIVGRNEQKTQEAARSLDIPGFTDPQALIHNPDVDAMVVCYPSALHAKYVIAALEQGKDVFCETPAAYSLAEAEWMARTAADTGKNLSVALFGRFVSPYRHVHDLAVSHELGEIRAVFSNRRTPPVWGGGWDEHFILDLMLHDIDYICWLLGKPAAVTSQGLEDPGGGWNHVSIQMAYENTLAVVEGCGIMPVSFPFSTSLRVVGSQAAVDLNWYWGGDQPVVETKLYPREGGVELLSIEEYDPYEAECRYFIDCLQGKADPTLFSIDTACDSLGIALTAKTALERQAWPSHR